MSRNLATKKLSAWNAVRATPSLASEPRTSRLEDEIVRLRFEEERRDRYGRQLAYVWMDGRLFNRVLVRRGFGTVKIYQPNDQHEAILRAAEARAQAEGRGLWSACPADAGGDGGGGDGGDGGGGGGGCDPSYPGVCIAPPPPDLDCAGVGHRNFRVTGGDPHGFDADTDGIGCET